MAVNIPTGVWNFFNDSLLLFTRTATLVYPEKKEDCPNCIMSNMGTRNRSVSVYQPGGPYPFDRGMPCPYCGGKGYKAVEATEDISVRIYWDQKSWIKTGAAINIPNGGIQTIGFITDLEKIEKCKYMIPSYNTHEDYKPNARYEKVGASIPWGFKQNTTKYLATFWTQANG